MRILHVIADLERERGGPAHVAVELAELMARRGHQVTVVATDRGLPPEFRSPAEPRRRAVIEAYPIAAPRFWGTSWAMRRRLARLIPETDVVHLHSLYLFHDWVTGTYCRRYRVPYILRPHGTLDPFLYRRHRWRKWLLERLFQDEVQRRAAFMHYTTEEERRLAAPYALNPRSWVVPIGIDLGAFDGPRPRKLRERYPEIGDRKVVLFFGRLNFKKGLDVTIKAFAELARERDDVFLLLAGPDGGLERQARQWVAEAGLGGRALFTGMVTGEDKQTVLAGSEVFLLPSQAENFGLSVIEAAACGLPVIISDRVNLWREIDQAKAGLVAPPAPDAFARHLRWVLEHPQEAREMGRRAAALVRRDFGWDALAPRYEAMYRAAIGAGPDRKGET